MNEFWAKGYADAHMLNIVIHVGFGTLGILVGSLQLLRRKGDRAHRLLGRVFLVASFVVSVTALIGALTFNRDPFLMTLTAAMTYNWFAGWRALSLRTSKPGFADNFAAVGALMYCIFFVLYAQRAGTPEWSSITVNSAVGFLLALSVYDLLRNFGGTAWLSRTWLLEHIYKIIGGLSAMVSAAVGNLFVSLGPIAQVGPSFVFLAVTLVYMARYRGRPERRA